MRFYSASFWARLALFWLAFWLTVGIVPLTAQSTTPGPRQANGKQESVKDFDSLLQEALKEAKDSLPIFEQAKKEAEIWRLESGRLSLELTKARKGSERLSQSLKDSLEREEALKKASEAKSKADQEAIDRARKERDDATAFAFWVGVGGLVLGACGGAVLSIVF